jgi:UDP-N-acetylmuramate dehydrogenase
MEWKGIRGTVLEKVSMKRYTSMRVGGPVDYLIYPVDGDDLKAVVRQLNRRGVPYRFLGNGTNVIVHDAGFKAALIRITRMRSLRYGRESGRDYVDVSGGVSLSGLIRENARHALAGLELLYWIPGTVGGAVKMNAGSFGASISDALTRAEVMDEHGNVTLMEGPRMAFGHRTSAVGGRHCVLRARFALKAGDRDAIRADMERVYTERKARHPMESPSAGSVFKGLHGKPAWTFIEKAGLKGTRIGDAVVSEKHANFIVNAGSAKAVDVKRLIDQVKSEVFERFGVVLEEEVETWGFDG